MTTIAAVIITRNEASRIQRLLESIKDLVSEIIVVDDHSTDATGAMAAEGYGARVFVRALNGDFAAQRNYGAQQASADWILALDADEEVPAASVQKIKAALKESQTMAAFELYRLNHFLNHPIRHAGAYARSLKLYRKDCALYQGAVHEALLVKGAVGTIDADICHYAVDSIEQIFMKTFLYTKIEARVYCQEQVTVSLKEISYRLTWKAAKNFFKLYVKKRGFRDGMHGLVWCVCNVIGPQIRWMMIWEEALKQKKLVA